MYIYIYTQFCCARNPTMTIKALGLSLNTPKIYLCHFGEARSCDNINCFGIIPATKQKKEKMFKQNNYTLAVK